MVIIISTLASVALLINVIITCNTLWNCKNIKFGIFKSIIILCFLILCFLFSLALNENLTKNSSLFTFPLYYFFLFLSIKTLTKIKIVRIIYICLLYIFLATLISSSFTILFDIFQLKIQNFDVIDSVINLLFNLSCIIILILYRKGKIFKGLLTRVDLIPKSVYVFILVMLSALSGLISFQHLRIENLEVQIRFLRVFSIVIIPVLILIIIFLVINSVTRKISENISTTLENQVKIQVRHYEQINKINADLRGFKHDYKNHMLCLKSMIESGSTGEASDYIENLGDFTVTLDKTFDTGNYIADALLDEKNTLCTQKNIAFECRGVIPFERINPVDLCVLLANLLDNAIEACEKISESEKRKINTVLDFKNNHLYIKISNSIHEAIVIHNNSVLTTKDDKSAHGFGLLNIHKVVEKYDGNLKIHCKDELFIVEIIMPL